jgi:hypothetical protein
VQNFKEEWIVEWNNEGNRGTILGLKFRRRSEEVRKIKSL